MYKTEALKISLESPSVLTMLIFPYNVNFLLFQVCSEFSKSRILAPKLSSLRDQLLQGCGARVWMEDAVKSLCVERLGPINFQEMP